MSWHYSRELVEEYLVVTSLDGKPSVQWKSMPIAHLYLPNDRMKEFSRLSRFGMMFEPLTENVGEELLTWYLAGFPVSHSVRLQEGEKSQKIYGQKCGELLKKSSQNIFLQKMFKKKQLSMQGKTLLTWVILPKFLSLERNTWVQTTFGIDFGYVHTPTTKANFAAKSMQKWPSCRNFVKAFGKPTPENLEYLMDWPIGWTDLKPLGMDKFRLWLRQHGRS